MRARPSIGWLVTLPSEHVVGFPLLATATLWVASGLVARIPVLSLTQQYGCVGVLVRNADGLETVRVDPRPHVDLDDGDPTVGIARGHSRRVVLDVTQLVDHWSIGPCHVALGFALAAHATYSAWSPLTVRGPSEAEAEMLATVRAERDDAGGWGAWARAAPPHRAQVAPPFSHDPLLYLRVLKYFYQGNEDLAQIDPHVLDVLPPMFAPEALALRAELAWARVRHPDLQGLAAQIRHEQPGLIWWLDRILNDQSSFAFARRYR